MAKILPIITHPNPILRKKSSDFEEENINSSETQALFSDMEKTMRKCDGVGLAAPQVGLNKRLIIVSDQRNIITMINPVITKKSFSQEFMEEGCLSVPAFYGLVKRHKWLHCEYTDKYGKKCKIKASQMLARVIQHETDHLDGILFIDKAEELKKINDHK